ncbi:MAG: GTP-binding protein [Bacteroidales bacterium]|nr:GTP-binding protein [Bacteroidales bacterium]MBD5206086.1 GTP-binding protein [Bacteroidales bacterium]MBD5223604.1 GTP-binding protein [Bacteroidales bacterium]
MDKNKELPVLLLTGYLGSGKTTLLNRILNNKRGIKFAVIVNDIGEVNIDAELIAKGGVVGGQDDSLVALQNGCICCTLQSDLIKQLTDLADSNQFDYIVIEASGICEPEPIAQTIHSMPHLVQPTSHASDIRLDCIVTVVDALRLRDEFESGGRLDRNNVEEEDIENLIIQQIEFCNIILLNKISEVSSEEAKHIRQVIRTLQPEARIIECDYCDVDLDQLLYTHKFNFEQVATSATWVKEIEKPLSEIKDNPANDINELGHEHKHEHKHEHEHHHEHEHEHHHEHEHSHEHEDHSECDHEHGVCHCHHHHHHHGEGEAEEYGIGTFVYYARRPFSLNKFDWLCAKNWPRSVIRAKGICYFKENPDMSYLFESAGRQQSLKEAGRWYATAPEEDLKILLANEPGLMRDWDPEFGDRMQKIVFIGKDMDKAQIKAALDSCLD